MVWSHPKIRELASKHFVLAADDTYLLRSGDGPEGAFFLKVVSQGHYGDSDSRIAKTWQGVYAFTPSGELLASENRYNAEAVEAMLVEALEKWNALDDAKKSAHVATAPTGSRWQHFYPHDGLVLRSYTRYLPHEGERRPGRRNMDYAWFTREEARRFLPARLQTGEKHAVDSRLIARLARLHFVNNVPCLSLFYEAKDVREAEMTADVTKVSGDTVHVRFEGKTQTRATKQRDRASRFMRVEGKGPFVSERGYTGRIVGTARYDKKSERFVAFELVSLGEMRRNSWRPVGAPAKSVRRTPIGFSLSLAGSGPAERVPPAFVELYGWERPDSVRTSARKSISRSKRAQ